jgi:lysophospholipase L1-like esterase
MRSLQKLVSVIVAALTIGPGVAFYLTNNRVEVAMLGDSITAQMAPRKNTFPAPFNTATILGVSGNTVTEVAASVGSIPSTATHVVIQGGTNDLVGLGTSAGIIPGYTSMLNAIPSTKKVIVYGIPPVDEDAMGIAHPGWTAYLNNALIKEQNLAISEICRTHENCVIATGIMARKMTGKTTDGIHLTAASELGIIKALLPLLGL